jgi:hypothetical protein
MKPIRFVTACAMSLFMCGSASASSCLISLHNKSGVELVVAMKLFDANEAVTDEDNLTLADGETVRLPIEPTDATLSLQVFDNGQELGGGFYRDEELTSCQLNSLENQPICGNNPGPGELTLIRNNRNCP